MKKTRHHTTKFNPILCGALIGFACTLRALPVHANDNELRAGAVLQIPFSLNTSRPSFDPTKIRIGLTCQYTNIEDDKVTIARIINANTGEVLSATAREDKGNQVYGVEGNIFLEVFNKMNGSAEVLGLYGSNNIQGALGGGYSFADGVFLDAKAMFPYSEVGVRVLNQPEIYGGIKTLGAFNPAKDRWLIDTPVIPAR
jgi:hypothetical protein